MGDEKITACRDCGGDVTIVHAYWDEEIRTMQEIVCCLKCNWLSHPEYITIKPSLDIAIENGGPSAHVHYTWDDLPESIKARFLKKNIRRVRG